MDVGSQFLYSSICWQDISIFSCTWIQLQYRVNHTSTSCLQDNKLATLPPSLNVYRQPYIYIFCYSIVTTLHSLHYANSPNLLKKILFTRKLLRKRKKSKHLSLCTLWSSKHILRKPHKLFRTNNICSEIHGKQEVLLLFNPFYQ